MSLSRRSVSDAKSGHSIPFTKVRVEKYAAHQSKAVTERVRAVISGFKIEMATESVKINIDVEAVTAPLGV